uniref:Uncharacterized protein n=1 Tax=Arion vulgaris TaxID=1028688 RepID=A0A0B7ADF5_9EUPU
MLVFKYQQKWNVITFIHDMRIMITESCGSTVVSALASEVCGHGSIQQWECNFFSDGLSSSQVDPYSIG